MEITVSSRHMEVSEPLRDHAEEKANKLTKYFDRIMGIEVVLNVESGQATVEIIVKADHHTTFVANHNEGDAYACIDACVDKLERQLSEHKKKLRNRKHPAQ